MQTMAPSSSHRARTALAAVAAFAIAWMATLATSPAFADAAASGIDSGVAQQVRDLALAGTRHAAGGVTRVEIELGQLDPRLHLAPCARVEPYLPAGARLWGRTHIGLRCTQGPSAWNVYLPITVKIYGKGVAAAVPLAVGAVIAAGDVAPAEVDLAEDSSAALTDPSLAVGRTVARVINAGQSVRIAHLKPRQWFGAGDMVRVVAKGPGFSVVSEAQAITAGMEGQVARVRTDSGRILVGVPDGEHSMTLTL